MTLTRPLIEFVVLRYFILSLALAAPLATRPFAQDPPEAEPADPYWESWSVLLPLPHAAGATGAAIPLPPEDELVRMHLDGPGPDTEREYAGKDEAKVRWELLAGRCAPRVLLDLAPIDLVELVRSLDAIDSTAPIGVEIFSDELAAKSPIDAARRAGAAARSVLERARG